MRMATAIRSLQVCMRNAWPYLKLPLFRMRLFSSNNSSSSSKDSNKCNQSHNASRSSQNFFLRIHPRQISHLLRIAVLRPLARHTAHDGLGLHQNHHREALSIRPLLRLPTLVSASRRFPILPTRCLCRSRRSSSMFQLQCVHALPHSLPPLVSALNQTRRRVLCFRLSLLMNSLRRHTTIPTQSQLVRVHLLP